MRWMVLILGVFLFGCVVAPYQARYQGPPPLQSTRMAQVDAMAGAQQPVAYKVGFMAGCDSGYVSAGNNSFIFKKDVERFGKDDLYQQGWTDGYNRCASGGGPTASRSYYNSYYGGYYPGTYYSGYYESDYYYPYYTPGFSLWLGDYGHHDTYVHHDSHYYTPWYGGGKHKGGHGGGPYIGKQYGGGHKGGGHKGGGHKGRGHKGGGHKGKGGGHKGGGGWIR